jgi:thioredoxin 1
MAEIRDVTDASFQKEVLESEVPVLVDFWGEHCPACRQISPILRELADQAAGTFKIVKIHAAENPVTAGKFGIRSMPTVLLFAGAAVRGQLVGARPKSDFLDLVARV